MTTTISRRPAKPMEGTPIKRRTNTAARGTFQAHYMHAHYARHKSARRKKAVIVTVQTIGPETLNMTDKENEPSWIQFE